MKRTLKFSFLLTVTLALFVMTAYFSSPVHATKTLPGGTYNASSLGDDPDIVFNGNAEIVLDEATTILHSLDAKNYNLKISGSNFLVFTSPNSAITAGNLTLDGVKLMVTKTNNNSNEMIKAKNITISNANLLLGDAYGSSNGLTIDEKVLIKSSKIKIEGDYCIRGKAVEISDSELTLYAHDDSIKSENDTILKGCKLDFTGGFGIWPGDGKCVIENCTGQLVTESTVINGSSGVSITGSTLSLTTGSIYRTNTLYTYDGEILVKNSTRLYMRARKSPVYSYILRERQNQ